MKKNFSLLILAVVVISGFAVASCEKEGTEANMIIRNWNLTSKFVLGVEASTECERASKWNFKADNTYVITYGLVGCPAIETGTWQLADNGKTLTLDGKTAYKVVSNSILNLVIEGVVTIGDAEGTLTRWEFN